MTFMSKVAEAVLGAETEAGAAPCEGPDYWENRCLSKWMERRSCYYDYCEKRKYCGSWQRTNVPC